MPRRRDGFVCPSRSHRGRCFPTRQPVNQCNRYKRQTPLTAGTIFHKREIARFARRHLAAETRTVTDGSASGPCSTGPATTHRSIRIGSGRVGVRMAPFKWVNTALGNIKSAITGTYQSLDPPTPNAILLVSPGAITDSRP